MSEDDDQVTTTRLSTILRFIGGAWLNRRYTRLVSSLILAILPIMVFYSIEDFEDAPAGFNPIEGFDRLMGALTPVGILFGIALLAFYPLGREIYFRMTRPLAEGLSGVGVIGIFLVVMVILIRIWLYLVVWLVSIPLGIIGLFYLAFTEASGKGYRLA